MILRPLRSTRTDTRFTYTTLFRSLSSHCQGSTTGSYAARSVSYTSRRKVATCTYTGESGRMVERKERTMLRGERRLGGERSEEHTSELQSLMRISYAVFCLKKKQSKEQQAVRNLREKNTVRC